MTTRREFIGYGLTASGSLLIGACKTRSQTPGSDAPVDGLKTLYLEVTRENEFFLTFDKAEMGQGVITGQATLFGEEADINPATFKMVAAKAHEAYGTALGHMMTGGSTSTKERFTLMRQVGAAYRHGLKRAAAIKWKVSPQDITTGNLIHARSGKKVPYAAFNQQLMKLKLDDLDLDGISLKPSSQWKYIGKFNQSLDAKDKVTGVPEFGVDFSMNGMRTAIVIRPPAFGGRLKSYDAKAIKALGDVQELIKISRGLAIVCNSYWRCLKVKNALTNAMIEWDLTEAHQQNSQELLKSYRQTVEAPPPDLDKDQKLVSAQYSLPFLNHAPMEPQNAVGHKQKDRIDFWLPTQGPTFVQAYCEKHSDFNLEQIHVHNSKYLGGGFGRRGQMDYVAEIVELTLKSETPIKLMWSREDDMQHSPLRPMSVHQLHATIGSKVDSWQHTITAESIMRQTGEDLFPLIMPSWLASSMNGLMGLAGVSPMTTEGAEQPYDLPYDVDSIDQESPVPVTFWRSVGNSHNGFVVESFVDEVAHGLAKDPLEFRLDLLKTQERARKVVEKVALMAGWTSYESPKNRALGLAYHYSFNTHCAQIADVEVVGETIKVHKVFAAVDCGIVVNPDIVVKQVQSGIIFGLTAALHGQITFNQGAITQSNFHDYPLLKLHETPDIDVAIIKSNAEATGIGEPGLPPIAGAVGNAIFRATGQRCRDLPFQVS